MQQTPEHRGTIELFASGLGLMLYSSTAGDRLDDGRDYMPAGQELSEPLRNMVECEQRVVLLGTGSPQLNYLIRVFAGEPTPVLRNSAGSTARFGIQLDGRALLVRDGYDPMNWSSDSPFVQRIPMDDGYYVVDALWVPDGEVTAMVVELYFQPAGDRIGGDGWPYLEYRLPG